MGMRTATASSVVDEASLEQPIAKALAWLDREQNDEGYWAGILESNCCIEAEWLLAMHVLDFKHPRKADIAATLLAAQRGDGAWEVYYDAPGGDINATVECYAALRSTGMAADAEPLVRARRWIETHGGLSQLRIFSRYWLALIGEWPWDKTPNLPPELIALPTWLPFNIYRFSSWSRGTIVPLAVLSARRLARPLPDGFRLDELFPHGRDHMDYRLPRNQPLLSVGRLFLAIDRLLHWYQRLGLTPGRGIAVKTCLKWILCHQEADGSWGGIQPPWVYSLLALYAEGYPLSHPVMTKGLGGIDKYWSHERGGTLHIQACESSVWDTWLALQAVCDCERPITPGMERALDWLLDRQSSHRGDWARLNPELEPGGWAFERANIHYPDIDDTAVALCVLASLPIRLRHRTRVQEAARRALAWARGMQSANGGWGAFDRDNDSGILTRFPFSDFGEVLDPPTADVTARMVEALGLLGFSRKDSAVEKACSFLREEQEPDGSWFGRWGVNYIHGTSAVLTALAAIGENMNAPYIRRAACWLVEHQNADGGWGETCASYMDRTLRGRGESTASQTAWSLMALLAVRHRDDDEAVRRGLLWLVRSQREDGSWDEPQFTGTGFPGYGFGGRLAPKERNIERRSSQGGELQRGFMINYNLYRHYFPLMALGRARSRLRRDSTRSSPDQSPPAVALDRDGQ